MVAVLRFESEREGGRSTFDKHLDLREGGEKERFGKRIDPKRV